LLLVVLSEVGLELMF